MSTKKIYFENLDGLRAIAFLAVFLYHVFGYLNYHPSAGIESFLVSHLFMIGHLGVNLFFVLSGFLISFLLLKEKDEKGGIHIRNFYMRRVLRIWPLFYLVLLIGFFIFPGIIHQFNSQDVSKHLIFYLSFLNNFDRIDTHFVGIGNDSLGVLWSIAVEEQFYLFWPLLLQFLPSKKLPYLFVSIIGFGLYFRSTYIIDENILYYHTFSVMSDLAVGSACAWLVLYQLKFKNILLHLPSVFIKGIYLLFFILVITFKDWVNLNTTTRLLERVILALFFGFIILEQCYSGNSFYKFKNRRYLTKLGLISYGLYCLHLFSISFIQKVNSIFEVTELTLWQFYSELVLCLGLSTIICYMSYRYFEKKFLRLKSIFE